MFIKSKDDILSNIEPLSNQLLVMSFGASSQSSQSTGSGSGNGGPDDSVSEANKILMMMQRYVRHSFVPLLRGVTQVTQLSRRLDNTLNCFRFI